MSKGKNYTVGFKRKRNKKTNYRKRLKFVASGKIRFVLRQTTNDMSIQAVNFSGKGDEVLKTVKSSDLKKYGWEGNPGNTTSAYLAGLLFGQESKSILNEGIIDLGLRRLIKGSRISATIKGIKDSGIEINASESIFPTEDRIKNIKKDLSSSFEEVKKKIEAIK